MMAPSLAASRRATDVHYGVTLGGVRTAHDIVLSEWEIIGTVPDTEVPLPPTPGAVIEEPTDPTVDDAEPLPVGQVWVNTSTGAVWTLVDNTPGAAVWVLTTSSGLNFATSDGSTTVDPTWQLTFVGATLADLGSGVAEVTFTGGAPDDVDYLVGTAIGRTLGRDRRRHDAGRRARRDVGQPDGGRHALRVGAPGARLHVEHGGGGRPHARRRRAWANC